MSDVPLRIAAGLGLIGFIMYLMWFIVIGTGPAGPALDPDEDNVRQLEEQERRESTVDRAASSMSTYLAFGLLPGLGGGFLVGGLVGYEIQRRRLEAGR